ncbi:hypothetical protein KI387_038122 [Taxus chinensis]|uniref:Reverse transcriptase domain-containing protein n=1 Tax=Taxus chinensis TaxID=29808 RepID=A0AA38FT27_TAXCH|nr:hypothetical protein KI387_038122 [Taxus chinensis]
MLLYADDLILMAKTKQGLQEHLKVLELFCQEVGMQVNIGKTKIMIFTLKKKKEQVSFEFDGDSLQVVKEYKYLGLDFHTNLSWETCRAKRIQEGGKLYICFKTDADIRIMGLEYQIEPFWVTGNPGVGYVCLLFEAKYVSLRHYSNGCHFFSRCTLVPIVPLFFILEMMWDDLLLRDEHAKVFHSLLHQKKEMQKTNGFPDSHSVEARALQFMNVSGLELVHPKIVGTGKILKFNAHCEQIMMKGKAVWVIQAYDYDKKQDVEFHYLFSDFSYHSHSNVLVGSFSLLSDLGDQIEELGDGVIERVDGESKRHEWKENSDTTSGTDTLQISRMMRHVILDTHHQMGGDKDALQESICRCQMNEERSYTVLNFAELSVPTEGKQKGELTITYISVTKVLIGKTTTEGLKQDTQTLMNALFLKLDKENTEKGKIQKQGFHLCEIIAKVAKPSSHPILAHEQVCNHLVKEVEDAGNQVKAIDEWKIQIIHQASIQLSEVTNHLEVMKDELSHLKQLMTSIVDENTVFKNNLEILVEINKLPKDVLIAEQLVRDGLVERVMAINLWWSQGLKHVMQNPPKVAKGEREDPGPDVTILKRGSPLPSSLAPRDKQIMSSNQQQRTTGQTTESNGHNNSPNNASCGILSNPKNTPPLNNVATSSPSTSERIEPFYVSLLINGYKLSNCILDFGASDNVMPAKLADALGLTLTKTIGRDKNSRADSLGVVAALLNLDQPPALFKQVDYKVEMVFHLKLLDNAQQWKVFNDDKKIDAFLQQQDNFEEIYYKGITSPPRQTIVGEVDSKIAGSQEIIQLKGNTIPKGLVSLEEMFDKHDQMLKKNEESEESSSSDTQLLILGADTDPKLVNLGAHISKNEFKSMSDTLNISSESEEISRYAQIDPITRDSDIIKRKRAQIKIFPAMMKRDEREGSTGSCIASRFADINDTDTCPEPISNLIDRSGAGRTSLMREIKSNGIIQASAFPVIAQMPEFVMECARSYHHLSRTIWDATGKTLIILDAKFINYFLNIPTRPMVIAINMLDGDNIWEKYIVDCVGIMNSRYMKNNRSPSKLPRTLPRSNLVQEVDDITKFLCKLNGEANTHNFRSWMHAFVRTIEINRADSIINWATSPSSYEV